MDSSTATMKLNAGSDGLSVQLNDEKFQRAEMIFFALADCYSSITHLSAVGFLWCEQMAMIQAAFSASISSGSRQFSVNKAEHKIRLSFESVAVEPTFKIMQKNPYGYETSIRWRRQNSNYNFSYTAFVQCSGD